MILRRSSPPSFWIDHAIVFIACKTPHRLHRNRSFDYFLSLGKILATSFIVGYSLWSPTRSSIWKRSVWFVVYNLEGVTYFFVKHYLKVEYPLDSLRTWKGELPLKLCSVNLVKSPQRVGLMRWAPALVLSPLEETWNQYVGFVD